MENVKVRRTVFLLRGGGPGIGITLRKTLYTISTIPACCTGGLLEFQALNLERFRFQKEFLLAEIEFTLPQTETPPAEDSEAKDCGYSQTKDYGDHHLRDPIGV